MSSLRVLLCGGTNHGAELTVLHGREVSVAKRVPVPPPSDKPAMIEMIPIERETYVRPSDPVIVAGVERWILKEDYVRLQS